jgi:16S rRNA (cytosine967-C5)-methyltransferase
MDVVLCDVPCSGLGIIRKKPDIRYKNLKETEDLPRLQLSILSNQANYVRPGGTLMYSTCTVLRRENEDVVNAFLESRPDFYTEPLELPEVFPRNETGMLTLIPGQYDTDGFFICRLRRKV